MLKQVTASYMHPDSPIGREYWSEVYAEARRRFGTSKLPFRSFQKVWVTATKADVYCTDGNSPDSDFAVLRPPPDYHAAWVVGWHLGVECEEDLVALNHNQPQRFRKNAEASPFNTDFTVEIFKKVILPKLREEINEGEHFVQLRQIYKAEILATWLKKSLHLTKNSNIRLYANSGKLHLMQIAVKTVKKFDPGVGDLSTDAHTTADAVTVTATHSQPNAPAFQIPENVEFFAKYVRLFKNGVFRCARREVADTPDDHIIRVYFSGAIDFRNQNE